MRRVNRSGQGNGSGREGRRGETAVRPEPREARRRRGVSPIGPVPGKPERIEGGSTVGARPSQNALARAKTMTEENKWQEKLPRGTGPWSHSATFGIAAGPMCSLPPKMHPDGWRSLARIIERKSSGSASTTMSSPMEQVFPFGNDDGMICAYSDSDWAGCTRARKSTSGGFLCIGVAWSRIAHQPRGS